MNLTRRGSVRLLVLMTLTPALTLAAADPKTDTPPASNSLSAIEIAQICIVGAGTLIVLAIVLLLMRHIKELRQTLATLSGNYEHVRKEFIQMALGVPDGTVRSALAILIVLGALLGLVAALAGENLHLKVPEVLTSIFGTILGFYFGRAGSVETSKASQAVANASETTVQAGKDVAAANEKAAQATTALQAVKSDQADTLSTQADAAFAVEKAVVAALPEPVDPAISKSLADANTALTAAQSDGGFDKLTAVYNQLIEQGPIALLIRTALPALTPLAPSGSSPLDAVREMLALSAKMSPATAPLWVARVQRQPYRVELFTPVVDDNYATSLIGQVPEATDLFNTLLQTIPTLTRIDLVSMALTESAADQVASRSKGSVTVAQAEPIVDALQQRAFEAQLAKLLTDTETQPLGGLKALFTNIDKTQANSVGQSALDILMLIARQSRLASVAATDLLPSAA